MKQNKSVCDAYLLVLPMFLWQKFEIEKHLKYLFAFEKCSDSITQPDPRLKFFFVARPDPTRPCYNPTRPDPTMLRPDPTRPDFKCFLHNPTRPDPTRPDPTRGITRPESSSDKYLGQSKSSEGGTLFHCAEV